MQPDNRKTEDLASPYLYLLEAVGLIGFTMKEGLLFAVFGRHVERVTREQKAGLAAHNSPFLLWPVNRQASCDTSSAARAHD